MESEQEVEGEDRRRSAQSRTKTLEDTMFRLSSTAFNPDSEIPRRHTCQGDDVSPQLAWADAPPGTESFALIVDDPDAPDPAAPKRVWVHWLRYNIPKESGELAEGAGNRAPAPAMEAITDANETGYHGPCPPVGRHRYFFRLFALDGVLPELGRGARRLDLEKAMNGHVLASAVLMGTYQKEKQRP